MCLMVTVGCVYTAEKDSDSGFMLSNEKIFSSLDFKKKAPPLRVWSKLSASYYTLMPAKKVVPSLSETGETKSGKAKNDSHSYDVVRVDLLTGKHDIVLDAQTLEAQALVLSGSRSSIKIEGLQFSADETKVLIYTNSQKVWRQKTRGDYWVFDLQTKMLTNVGCGSSDAHVCQIFSRWSRRRLCPGTKYLCASGK